MLQGFAVLSLNKLISLINDTIDTIDSIDNDISFIKTEIYSKLNYFKVVSPMDSKIMEYQDTIAKSNYKVSRLDLAISMYTLLFVVLVIITVIL